MVINIHRLYMIYRIRGLKQHTLYEYGNAVFYMHGLRRVMRLEEQAKKKIQKEIYVSIH